MRDAQIVGQRIKHYRKMKSLTQKELAAEIGVVSSFIANIEQGQKGISLDKLVDICRCFNIGLSDLLPIETSRDREAKEKMIEEILDSLGVLEIMQIRMIKAMIDGIAVAHSNVDKFKKG